MGDRYTLDVDADVTVTVNDPEVIRRVVENIDGWREHNYDLRTEQDVLEHLAFNALCNGYERVNRLDGWADLADDAAVMEVSRDPYFSLARKLETRHG